MLNHRVVSTPSTRCRVHPTHWLISTQVPKLKAALKKEKVNDLTGKKADLKARLLEKLGL